MSQQFKVAFFLSFATWIQWNPADLQSFATTTTLFDLPPSPMPLSQCPPPPPSLLFAELMVVFFLSFYSFFFFFSAAIIAKCAAGGRDHTPCCVRRGVPSTCMSLCRGVLPVAHTSSLATGSVNSNATTDCLSYAGNILQCLEEGKYYSTQSGQHRPSNNVVGEYNVQIEFSI